MTDGAVTDAAPSERAERRRVGPVLQAGEVGRAVARAIVELNPGAEVIDRGAYYRVLVDGRCTVTRDAVERIGGRAFQLPGDLERVMPAFAGHLSINPQAASWTHEVE
ncbi:MAG TPA: MmoB/DmpM family protein [Polyangiaceae bacterium]|nr:MmoB/DmpM family protein [Polyangiaceae bacterium]